MVVDRAVKQLVEHLAHQDPRTVVVFGNPIAVNMLDQETKFTLSSSIYEGGNYIPQSVRLCLTKRAPFPSGMITFTKVDEDRYQVTLHYLGSMEGLAQENFKDLLEEFGYLTEEWRLYLDQHDQNDLIHIPVK